MGILDVFRKKKDEFAPPDFGANPLDQGPGFGQPQQGFPDNAPTFGEQDPFSQQQQFPNFQPEPQPQQPQFSPEHMGFERIPPGQQGYSSGQSHAQMLNDISIGKDFELVNAKLDAIKAELDSINQRIKRIERINEEPGAKKDQWF